MRRRETSNSPTDMLPDYKRRTAGKPQKHFARNLAALGGLCLVVYLFIRASEITATLGISTPTRPKGPRGFTAAAGYEAAARHHSQMQQQQHTSDRDDGSFVVDTAADSHGAQGLHQATKMDESSLNKGNAPHFVGDKLVDPPDFNPTGVKPQESSSTPPPGTWSRSHPHGVYSLSAVDIDGKECSLQEYAGKVTLIVNVASKCGYTDANYKGLQVLYDKYKGSGLEVLAFPCNQFGAQEPGSNAEVKQFATQQYHTTFPMFSKVDVNGPNSHPVYKYLKEQLHIQDPPGLAWNFQKVLVNRAGKPVLMLTQEWDQGRVESAVYNLLVSASVQ